MILEGNARGFGAELAVHLLNPRDNDHVTVHEVDGFVAECREMGLPVIGLMCIPPVEEEPSLHFALLAKIAKRNELKELSMGMSGDFETAIAQGATSVRVGSAIFGARVPSG